MTKYVVSMTEEQKTRTGVALTHDIFRMEQNQADCQKQAKIWPEDESFSRNAEYWAAQIAEARAAHSALLNGEPL